MHIALDISIKSIYPNRIHACRHDSHVAILLGAAKILTELKEDLEGNVKLFFQPAEEPAVGAKWCVDQGCMADVDACYGCHIATWLDSPYISVEEGPRMAASVEYKYNTPAVIHDNPMMNRIAMDAALKLYGPEGVALHKPAAASDDFSYFSEVKPGLFAFIGACNAVKNCAYGHHHPKFNIDEDAFVRGTATYAQVAVDFLADKEISK